VPVDSEHSAILQCLAGGRADDVRRLVLTASGGPFRTLPAERLAAVTPADALRHPTWEMGAKVTIDSRHAGQQGAGGDRGALPLRGPVRRIEAVVHPQSIVHSMVEMVDGSVLAQMGFPTMELPVLYALTHPERLPYATRRFDPVAAGALTFEAVWTRTASPRSRWGWGRGARVARRPRCSTPPTRWPWPRSWPGASPSRASPRRSTHALAGWDGGAAAHPGRRARGRPARRGAEPMT
jgi:1-deoxy-D-xylulose-5-phosphate reductoisomerase